MAAAAGAARLSSLSHLMDEGVGSRSSRSGRRLPPEFGRDLAVLMILKFMLLCGYKNMAVNNIYAFQRLQMPQGLPNKGSLKRNGLTKKGDIHDLSKGEARAAAGPWRHRRHGRRSVGRRDVRICPALTTPSDHPREFRGKQANIFAATSLLHWTSSTSVVAGTASAAGCTMRCSRGRAACGAGACRVSQRGTRGNCNWPASLADFNMSRRRPWLPEDRQVLHHQLTANSKRLLRCPHFGIVSPMTRDSTYFLPQRHLS
ncbi:uncharacterized protein [Aegilops tauschii subsp. strangulata]|uniref:uncharacterized protein isoform X2 n=1 Tax=Aegilops tauschii subsp. strangulata TaxID=200361 RepID=UPI001ABCD3C6|nr:uncharacterized protein LOC109773990 isoform X2 [Aegilops tauschii subsp. strangulata]